MDGTASTPAAPVQPSTTTTPAPTQGQPRSADGRYATGTAPGAQGAASVAEQPWKRSFAVRSKSGGEETLEVDEAAVTRALAFEREGHHRLRLLNEDRAKFTNEQRAHQAAQQEFEEAISDPSKMRALINKRAPDEATAKRWRAAMVRADMEDHNLSPEERELRELRQMKAQREMEEAERQKKEEAASQEARLVEAAEKIRPQLVRQFTAIIDAGGLPKTTATLESVAEAWKRTRQEGLDLDPEELGAYVKHEMDGQLDARLSDPALTNKEMVERYPAFAARMRAAIREEIMAKRSGGPGAPPQLNREGPSLAPSGPRPGPRVRSAAEDRVLSKGGTPTADER